MISIFRPVAIAALLAIPLGHTQALTPIQPEELVAPAFEITGGVLEATVRHSVAGRIYQLQVSENLTESGWQDIENEATGDGNDLTITTAHTPGAPRRFFRLKLDANLAPTGFVFIPAGSFTMGASLTEASGLPAPEDSTDEIPTHTVEVDALFLQKTEVTKAQWDEVRLWATTQGYSDMPPGAGPAGNQPVNEVNWYDVVKWCNARSEKDGLTPVYLVSEEVFRTGSSAPTANWSANGYRLPTEAEWEKAARGGLQGKRFPTGDTISTSQANYRASDAESGLLVNVASYPPNGYGLHDMAGSVWEWCWDHYRADYYGSSPATNPRGPAAGNGRCMRGGCWYDELSTRLRCANRGKDDPTERFDDVGFRIARRIGQ